MKVYSTIVTMFVLIVVALPNPSFGKVQGARQDPELINTIDLNIDFPGGSIAEFVELIRDHEAYKGGIESNTPNIVVASRAKDFQLPEIKVKTTFNGIVELLGMLGHSNAEIMVQELNDDDSIFLVDVDFMEEPSVRVINTRQVLGRIEEQDLLSAIEIGLQMQGNGTNKSVELKLHKETGLMFVRGNQVETMLVDNIVQELHASMGIPSASGRGGMVPGSGGMMGGGGGGGGAGGMGMGGMGAPDDFGGPPPGFGGGMGAPGAGGLSGGGDGRGKFSGGAGMGMGAGAAGGMSGAGLPKKKASTRKK